MTALRKVNSTYYVRARLPKHLNFDRNEICFSLGTRDRGRAAIAVSIFKSLLARPLLTNSAWLKEATLKLFRAIERQVELSLSEELIPALVSAAYPNDLLSTAFDRNEVSAPQLKLALDMRCPDFLNELGVSYQEDSKAFELLKQKVMGIEFAMGKFAAARKSGDIETQITYQEKLATFETQKLAAEKVHFKSVELPKLSKMTDIFLEQWRNPKDGKPMSENRKNKLTQTFNEVLFFIGDKPVNFYTEQDMQLLFDYFAKTPKGRNKRYPKKSKKELLELNVSEDQLQSYENKIKARQKLRQFFEWVIEHAKASSDVQTNTLELINPCNHIKILKDGRVSKRTCFTKLDEKEIFNRKLYLKQSVKDGLPIIREDHQYWGGLILRATGTRPNELFQSELRNWKYDHSVNTWVLWTSDSSSDQHIKNQTSIRAVPMPQIVMDKGFDQFIRHKKATNSESTKLFEEIRPVDLYYSTPYTQWFNNTLMSEAKIDKRDELGRKKSAYSMRHTFITRARKDGARFDVIQQNIGHSLRRQLGVTADYLDDYDVEELYEHLSHLTFPALENVPTYNEWKSNLLGRPPD